MLESSCEPAPIPQRHGADRATGQRIGRTLRWTTRGDPTPSSQRWRALGNALCKGDPVMDDLLAWMQRYGMREGRALFAQAAREGIDNLPEAPEPLRAFFESVEQGPEWRDETLLARGTRCCQRSGLTGMRVLRDAALMPGYQASAVNRTLVLTGALTSGPQRRLAETTRWWIDCTGTGGMARFGDGYRSTLHVRLIHALVRQRVAGMPEWRTHAWGLPINQLDSAATQLGFSVVFLLASRALGVAFTPGEGHAVMHLWRYIGWLIGVDECWLPTTEQAGRTLLYQILLSQAPPDDSSRELGYALMNEPLQRPYPNLAWLRGRYERARHLSITRLFVDRQGMRDLGLPAGVVPWYPAIAAPINLARHTAGRLVPGASRRMADAGRAAQANFANMLFGDDEPGLYSPTP